MRAGPAAMLIVLLALSARAASAGPPTDGAASAPLAEALFRQGRDAFEQGSYEQARASFAESQRLEPAAGTLLNLALAEWKLGRLSLAWQHAKEALDALAPSDERAHIARQLFQQLDARVPRLKMRWREGPPAGARVRLDSLELRAASIGALVPTDPGVHTVVVTAPGRAERRFEVTLEESSVRQLTIEPGAPLARDAGDAATTAREPFGSRRSGLRSAAVASLVAAGAALCASGVMGAMVLVEKGEVADHCSRDRGCDATAFEAADAGKTYSAIGTGVFIGGAALSLAATLVLVLTAGGDAPPAAHTTAPAALVRAGTVGLTF